jgi:predicted Zn finger-like uncharacterized protein
MRLICPKCDAQYDISDDVIPDGGRDVQCSSCAHTWFQMDKPKVAGRPLMQRPKPRPTPAPEDNNDGPRHQPIEAPRKLARPRPSDKANRPATVLRKRESASRP